MAYLKGQKGTVTARTLDSPVLTTPALGTPASGVMTNMTGAVEASLVDDAVTLAKMAAGTDGNIISYDASGDPVAIATGTDGQVLTSTGAGSPPAFEAASGGGGLTNASMWRLHTTLDAQSGVITGNLEETDTNGYATVGSSMTEASGVFSFPNTGVWRIEAGFAIGDPTSCGFVNCNLQTTVNNSSYDNATEALQAIAVASGEAQGYAHFSLTHIFDVTSVSTHKVKFLLSVAYPNQVVSWLGSENVNYTHFTFTQVGDT